MLNVRQINLNQKISNQINNKYMNTEETVTEQSLGQKRVKAEFNPAKDNKVDHVKNQSANLIDLIGTLRTEDASGELHRLISIAQTEIETACMYAVKACFTK